MSPRVTVQVQNPEFGKGWYKITFPRMETLEDEDFIRHTMDLYPDATAVRISRDYPLGKNAV